MKKIYIIATALFLAACGGKSTDKNAELNALKKQRTEIEAKIAKLESELSVNAPKAEAKDVAILDATETSFKNYIEIQGRIDAEDNVQVSSETPGVVTAVYAKIGQQVSRGQVLAQLDDQVLKQQISEAQTQLELATTLYERQKNLWDQKIGTEVQFLNAQTQKNAAERRIATIRSQISMYKVKAPISGTIDLMDLKVGQAVSPGISSIRIVNASKLKAKAQLAESYAGTVSQGDEVNVIFPDIPDSLNTKISFVSKTIDPASRSFDVQINLPSNAKYRPNMIAILKIVDYTNNKAIVIPINAVQKAESGSYVYVAEGGKAKRAEIKTGKTSSGKIEVLSGLKAGDKVIIGGLQDLNADDTVKF